MEQTKVTCENCHATFLISEEKCPYCGAMNVVGSTFLYQEKLEHLKYNVGNLDNLHREAYHKEIRQSGRVIKNVLLTAVIVAAVLLISFFIQDRMYRRSDLSTEELLLKRGLQQEVFAQLDAYYEAEDYDSMLDYRQGLFEREDYELLDLYEWKHYNFLEQYDAYQNCLSDLDYIRERTVSADYMTFAAASCIGFIHRYDSTYEYQFTDRDLEVLENRKQEIANQVEEVLLLSPEQTKAYYEQALKDDYYETSLAEKKLKPYIKQLRKEW